MGVEPTFPGLIEEGPGHGRWTAGETGSNAAPVEGPIRRDPVRDPYVPPDLRRLDQGPMLVPTSSGALLLRITRAIVKRKKLD